MNIIILVILKIAENGGIPKENKLPKLTKEKSKNLNRHTKVKNLNQ